MFIEPYFNNNIFKTTKIKNLFFNSDKRNTSNNKNYLSLLRNIGIIKYSDRSSSGNKTSDKPEKYKLVNVGDIVINPMNATIGSLGISNYDGCLSGVYIVLSPKKNINSRYYSYVFSEKGFQKYLKTISYGIMEIRESLNKTEFFQLKIPEPSLTEQKLIVNFLDKKINKIDQLIKKSKSKIKILEKLKIEKIDSAVTKGLKDQKITKKIDLNFIRETPKNWEINRLAVLGDFFKGRNITKEDLTEKGKPVILYTHIYTTYNRITSKIKYFVSVDKLEDKTKIKKGDFLFTSSGETIEEIGKTILNNSNEEAFIGGDIVGFRLKNTSLYNLVFFSYLLNSKYCQEQKSYLSRGDIAVHIYKKQIRELKILIPPKEEQDEIAIYLDNKLKIINEIIQKEQKRVELLYNYKNSIISEIINGRMRVSN